MAKKRRRGKRSRDREKGRAAATKAPAATPEEQLREEYAYVLQDLRRVSIVAAAMFILLIALNLIL